MSTTTVAIKNAIGAVIRVVGYPFLKLYRWFFDPRFRKLEERLDQVIALQQAADPFHEHVARLESRIDDAMVANAEALAFLGQLTRRVLDQQFAGHRDLLDAAERTATRLEADREVLEAVRRSTESVADRIGEGGMVPTHLEAMRHEHEALQHRAEEARDEALRLRAVVEEVQLRLGDDAPPEDLADLTAAQAHLLNFAESHRGYAAQRGLWFNPPLSLGYRPGDVGIGNINERILEVPYTLANVATAPVGSRVIDVGCNESLVAYTLASLGYRVTGIDLRPYALEHPNLTTAATPFAEWEHDGEPFDVAVCLSAIEHFGLVAYGADEPRDLDADRRSIERLHAITRPGGRLVFTAPFGRPDVGAFQRVYDLDGLERLLDGWEVTELQLGAPSGGGSWSVVGGREVADKLVAADHHGVVLLTAERRP